MHIWKGRDRSGYWERRCIWELQDQSRGRGKGERGKERMGGNTLSYAHDSLHPKHTTLHRGLDSIFIERAESNEAVD